MNVGPYRLAWPFVLLSLVVAWGVAGLYQLRRHGAWPGGQFTATLAGQWLVAVLLIHWLSRWRYPQA